MLKQIIDNIEEFLEQAALEVLHDRSDNLGEGEFVHSFDSFAFYFIPHSFIRSLGLQLASFVLLDDDVADELIQSVFQVARKNGVSSRVGIDAISNVVRRMQAEIDAKVGMSLFVSLFV